MKTKSKLCHIDFDLDLSDELPLYLSIFSNMSCSLVNCSLSSLRTRAPVVFVVTAHVPNERNYEVLVKTLRHIRCHHPNDFVLVVDNASPKGVVSRAVSAARRLSAWEQSVNATHVVRREHSMGILSSWAATNEVLDNWKTYGVPFDWEYVIFLQHTTVPCRYIYIYIYIYV